MSAIVESRRNIFGRLYHGETSIDFYGRRFWGLAFSALLVLATVGSLVTRGLNLGIDFKGGIGWEVTTDTLSIDDARAVLQDNGINPTTAKVQERTSAAGRVLLIQVADQPEDVRKAITDDLAERAGVPADDVSTSSVTSTWGRSITEKAVRALVIFLVLAALFIAWRLEWRMAAASIVAMLHDVIVSVGIYSLFGFEVTPATVVAFLTLLGYSLYDSIVVFDKVQENGLRFSGARVPYADVMNVSMNQVLMRSLNTTLSSVLPVLSLLVIGSGIMGAVTLREFALALLVGMATGSYSSIFVAAPLVAMAKEREPKYAALRGTHVTGPELERLVLGGSPGARAAARRVGGVAEDDMARAATAPTAEPAALLTHPPRPRKKKRRT